MHVLHVASSHYRYSCSQTDWPQDRVKRGLTAWLAARVHTKTKVRRKARAAVVDVLQYHCLRLRVYKYGRSVLGIPTRTSTRTATALQPIVGRARIAKPAPVILLVK